MNKKRCPKCRGTGNSGQISSLRCNSCSGRGWFDLDRSKHHQSFRTLCDGMGIPMTVAPDDTPSGHDKAAWRNSPGGGDD